MQLAAKRWGVNVAASLLLLPIVCGVTCSLGINPLQGWMMRHHCPFSMLPHFPRPISDPVRHMPALGR